MAKRRPPLPQVSRTPAAAATARPAALETTRPAVWVTAALLTAGLVWLVVRERFYRGWIDDDAYISFRYARNLAAGHGLVFNPGERVEGYTNFLWTVLLALLHKAGDDLPRAAPFLGGVFSVATVIMATLGAHRLLGFSAHRAGGAGANPARLQPFAPVQGAIVLGLAPLLLCFSDSWAAWGVGGLENPLSAFLLTSSFYAYLRYLEESRRGRIVSCALLLALAVLNHPSNVVFAAIVTAHLLGVGGNPVRRRDPLVRFATAFLLPVGIWTMWRIAYYGDLLPNTFYAKVGFTRFTLGRGMQYMAEVLRAFPLAYAGTLALATLLARRRDWTHPAWILVVAILLDTLYILAVGGEQFPTFRCLVVAQPFFALGLALLAGEICRAFQSRRPVPRTAFAGGVAAVALVGYVLPLDFSPRVRILDEALRLGRTALSTTAALRLKESLPPETLFAHSGAGLIAYYTNFRWIDTLGLTDRHIAHTHVAEMGRFAAGHEKGDAQYVWSRQPDYVMFPGYPISDPRPGSKSDRELFAIPEFRTTYRLVRFPFEYQGPHESQPREYALFLWQRVDHSQAR